MDIKDLRESNDIPEPEYDRKPLASAIVYFVIICVAVLLRALSWFGVFNFLGTVGVYLINGLFQVVMLFMLPFLTMKMCSKKDKTFTGTFNYLSFNYLGIKAIITSIIVGILVYIATSLLSSLTALFLTAIGYTYSTGTGITSVTSLILGLVFTAILPAICEETTHRGMLLKANMNMNMNKRILLSALLFGLFHLNIEQFFYAFAIGIVLAYIAELTQSIYPSIIIHFTNNAIGLVVSFISNKTNASIGVSYFFNYLNAIHPILAVLVSVLVLALIIFVIINIGVSLYKTYCEMGIKRNIKIFEKSKKKSKKEELLEMREEMLKDVEESHKSLEETENSEDKSEDYKVPALEHVLESLVDIVLGMDSVDNKKDEKKIKALYIASIVLSGVVTVFSLIWGII